LREERLALAAEHTNREVGMRKWVAIVLSFAAVAATVIAISAVGASAKSAGLTAKAWGNKAAAPSAQRSAAPATRRGVQLIVLHTRSGPAKFLDNDRNKRESVGDSFLFTETFVNARGKRIGGNWVTCVLQFGGNTSCDGTFRVVGRGSFDISGTLNNRNTFISISGGTGAFSAAGGQVDTSADQGEKGKLFVFLRHLD
jgi:hypothetical protein